jgi:uncharacterized protein (DUF697 family)
MPSLPAFGQIRDFTRVLREISFDDERDQAERQPRLLILAPEAPDAAAIGAELCGGEPGPAVQFGPLDGRNLDLEAYDVVVVADPVSGESYDRLRRRSSSGGTHFFDLGGFGRTADWADDLRFRITRALPNLAPALGRWYPPFQRPAVRAVIEETARVNAQFALVSNATSIVPVVGSLAAVGADFLVLTKNQVMLIFKLAAIHGRDLRDHWSLMREMVPVVGVALGWRTLAREAFSFLPLLAGTAAKVGIAFTGTMAIGWAADFYYSQGVKPSREAWAQYYQEAGERLKSFSLPGLDRSRNEDQVIDITPAGTTRERD